MTIPKSQNFETLYQRLARYCAYQDRCRMDVKKKMLEWKMPESMKQKMMKQLEKEGFVDEQRFAKIYSKSKFRNNSWGKIRIIHELRARNIEESFINEAISELPDTEYETMVKTLIRKKAAEIKSDKTLNKREKIINFVVGKGYEIDLVLQIMNEIQL